MMQCCFYVLLNMLYMYCIYLFNCSNTVEMNIYRIKTLKFNLLFMTKFMLTHSSCFFLFLFVFKKAVI